LQHFHYERIIHFIKSLFKIKLEGNHLPFWLVAVMQIFISPGQAVLNCYWFDKPYWFAWMSLWIIVCILFANNLVKSFKVQLSREIGLKSLTVDASLFWGANVIKPLLMIWR
jgi:hypothetical protein